jgi:hypothetical protein
LHYWKEQYSQSHPCEYQIWMNTFHLCAVLNRSWVVPSSTIQIFTTTFRGTAHWLLEIVRSSAS